MAGANIGGGEWLFGPLVTAQYGGTVMWLAFTAIIMQVFYNLAVMRYTLYCGESIFVGFFRTMPGPLFWTAFYFIADIGGLWPYLSSNAATPLAAVILGRLPGAADDTMVRTLGYCIFLSAFVPLIFGGKIYNALERLLVIKLALILGYLSFLTLFFVKWETFWEIGSGLFKFGALPAGEFNWATLAAFAAVAGAGGLTNTAFSNFARDKGWAMGDKAGALPSAVGGLTVTLSHTGKIFDLTPENLARWRGWLAHIRRDQLALWMPGCVLGMILPSMVSYQFIRGIQGRRRQRCGGDVGTGDWVGSWADLLVSDIALRISDFGANAGEPVGCTGPALDRCGVDWVEAVESSKGQSGEVCLLFVPCDLWVLGFDCFAADAESVGSGDCQRSAGELCVFVFGTAHVVCGDAVDACAAAAGVVYSMWVAGRVGVLFVDFGGGDVPTVADVARLVWDLVEATLQVEHCLRKIQRSRRP